MKEYTGKVLSTLTAASLCGLMLWLTKGEHGVGWFVVALIIIWGS